MLCPEAHILKGIVPLFEGKDSAMCKHCSGRILVFCLFREMAVLCPKCHIKKGIVLPVQWKRQCYAQTLLYYTLESYLFYGKEYNVQTISCFGGKSVICLGK